MILIPAKYGWGTQWCPPDITDQSFHNRSHQWWYYHFHNLQHMNKYVNNGEFSCVEVIPSFVSTMTTIRQEMKVIRWQTTWQTKWWMRTHLLQRLWQRNEFSMTHILYNITRSRNIWKGGNMKNSIRLWPPAGTTWKNWRKKYIQWHSCIWNEKFEVQRMHQEI